MSARAAKILFVAMLIGWAAAFYYGFVLGLIAAIIASFCFLEALRSINLLPPRAAQGKEVKP